MGKVRSRILAMLMAMILCLGLLPAPALAYEQDIVTDGDLTLIDPDTGAPANPEPEPEEPEDKPDQIGPYTVTFELYGVDGVTPDPITVEAGETITLPVPQFTDPSFTFTGWRELETGRQWTENMLVTRDVTLVADWSYTTDPKDQIVVTFDYNGARDSYLIIATNANPYVPERPEDPVWDGYRFVGWATEDGTMWVWGTEITERLTLYAVWEPLGNCTITFDVMIPAIDDPDPITVPYGQRISGSVSFYNTYMGHQFQGWATEDGTLWLWLEGNSYRSLDVVTEDMTLYAVWDPPFDTDDTFSFGNWSAPKGQEQYFNPTYRISEQYLNYLLAGESTPRKGFIRNYADRTWGGSCFGMSAVYALKYAGDIDPGVFQSGAEQLWDLDWPSRNDGVNDLINFYHLVQFTSDTYALNNYRQDHSAREVNQHIVSQMQSTNQFAVICFEYGNGSGHAVVGKSITKDSNGNYLIDIWDNIRPEESVDGQLVISSDFRDAYFTSDIYKATEYNRNLELWYAATLESNTFSKKDLQGYIQGGRSYASSSANNFSVLGINVADFTVTTSDGRTATVKGGQQVSGDLILTYVPVFAGVADGYQYVLSPKDTEDLTISTNMEDATVSLLEDNYYATVEADDLTSVRFAESLVDSTTASASQQTITYTSDELGDAWNQLIISGVDTGFTLESGKESVSVSSDNHVKAKVSGMNVSDGKISSAQTISVTPAGVTVSTASGSLTTEETTEEPASSNPFTDVSADAYYHDAVLWAVENGITSGTSATTFSPNAVCTRAQAVTFLWRAAGSPEPGIAENPFTDVASDSYYYKAVLWAVEKGITSGTSATTFSPNVTCSRAQIVTFLWREQQSPSVSTSGAFTDVSADAYYAKAVDWAVSEGITSGTSATTFSPNANCTRAQIVTFLWRAYQG